MNRNYGIDRITVEEFYGNPITNERTMEILKKLNISAYDSFGHFRNVADLLKDLHRVVRINHSFASTRMATDAIDSIIESMYIKHDFKPAIPEESSELDMFLGTFKIIQGGVSL